MAVLPGVARGFKPLPPERRQLGIVDGHGTVDYTLNVLPVPGQGASLLCVLDFRRDLQLRALVLISIPWRNAFCCTGRL